MSKYLITAAETEARCIHEPWGDLRWMTSESIAGTEITVGRVRIKPGRSNPRHSHPNSEEVLYLLAGRLEHWVADEQMTLNAGDTLVVPAGVAHYARNLCAEDADMIVAYPTGTRQFRPEGETATGKRRDAGGISCG